MLNDQPLSLRFGHCAGIFNHWHFKTVACVCQISPAGIPTLVRLSRREACHYTARHWQSSGLLCWAWTYLQGVWLWLCVLHFKLSSFVGWVVVKTAGLINIRICLYHMWFCNPTERSWSVSLSSYLIHLSPQFVFAIVSLLEKNYCKVIVVPNINILAKCTIKLLFA